MTSEQRAGKTTALLATWIDIVFASHAAEILGIQSSNDTWRQNRGEAQEILERMGSTAETRGTPNGLRDSNPEATATEISDPIEGSLAVVTADEFRWQRMILASPLGMGL